jgi:hypothetical protein
VSHTGRTLLIAAIAFLAAVAGVFVGRQLVVPDRSVESGLHALVHRDLKLDPGQQRRIEQIEQRYALRRQAIELELRSDNARLADAINVEHGYGPLVSDAIDRSHHAMGELQKATLEHVFAMRGVLRADQAAQFDAAVTKALTVERK